VHMPNRKKYLGREEIYRGYRWEGGGEGQTAGCVYVLFAYFRAIPLSHRRSSTVR
jgi:hypothetical protein